MDDAALAEIMAHQDGVVSRRQVLAAGGADTDIETRLRRRRWARVHEGVYVDHTGPPTWHQRAWAAVLWHGPAALSGRSALAAGGVRRPEPGEPIELVVDRSRRVRDAHGVQTSQTTFFADVALLHLSPPRVRVEYAVLSVASSAPSDDAAVAVIADACQQRCTTAPRLADSLRSMHRLPRRRLLLEILEDVAVGAYSALERRYLRDVERAHGLPTGRRQQREVVGDRGRVVFRDVDYDELATLVELDGRLGHERATDRWKDLERDLDAAQTGRVTLRVGWRQALSPCRLATSIAGVLQARGWDGHPRSCGQWCVLPTPPDLRASPAPRAGDARTSAA